MGRLVLQDEVHVYLRLAGSEASWEIDSIGTEEHEGVTIVYEWVSC